MSRIVTAVRFVIGLAMVAGGAALAGPTVVAVVQELARQRQPAAAAMPGMPVASPVVSHPDWQSPAPPTLEMQSVVAGWPATAELAITAQDGPALDPHYQPPPPPAPLPPVAGDLTAMAPEVGAAYRSTLDVPPPPLLDAHQPPPLAVGWSAHDVVTPAPVAAMPDAVVPQAYVIRDGDDLTGIATRFYGHASAATAIWAANRDVVPDPNVLPIGAAIRMPPAWAVFAARGIDPRAIEPQSAAAPPPGAVAYPQSPPPTEARPVGWLARGPAAAAATAPQRPGSVRVAAGETLASLARRFYGDERMAARIWEANRDRLRSPELVVAGMELRLP